MDTLGTSVHFSEVVPSSAVEMFGQYTGQDKQFVSCREVVHSSEYPLLGVPLMGTHCIYGTCVYILLAIRLYSTPANTV